MTLQETIKALQKIALRHPNVRSVGESNIYEFMNANPSIKYGVFFLTQGTHRENEDFTFTTYVFNMFYIDRLQDDLNDNKVQIQSHAKEILSNVLRLFEDEYDGEISTKTYTTFTERFADLCAGCYVNVEITLPNDNTCAEEFV